MKNKLMIAVGVVIIIAGLFYVSNFKQTSQKEELVIKNLIQNWKDFEKTISNRPVLGATSWNYPTIVQIISSDKLLLEYDDGHIVKYSVVEYKKNGGVTFVEDVGKLNELSSDDWNLVLLKYGNSSGRPITFEYKPSSSGAIVNYEDWKIVDENPFTKEKVVKGVEAPITAVGGGNTAPVKISSVKIALLIDSGDVSYRGKGVARGCDKVVMVERQITPTTMPLNASLKLMFNDKTPWPYREGVPGNFVGGRPEFPLTFSKATLENGVAKVYLYGNVGLAGVCDDPRLTAQVEQTAFQFPSVKSVKIYVNDKEWVTPSGKGI